MKCTVMIWKSWVWTLFGLNLGCVVVYMYCLPKPYLNQKYLKSCVHGCGAFDATLVGSLCKGPYFIAYNHHLFFTLNNWNVVFHSCKIAKCLSPSRRDLSSLPWQHKWQVGMLGRKGNCGIADRWNEQKEFLLRRCIIGLGNEKGIVNQGG